jgi:hypothetical protein
MNKENIMQVKVLNGGDATFNALVYPPPDNNLLNYLQQNVEHARAAMSGISDRFVDMASNMYNKFNSNEVINAGKALLFGTETHLNHNVIYPVSYGHLAEANYVMQRYIIAQPDVNKMYQNNTCEGFQDTYVDFEPDNEGTERMDYRNVMDGVIQYDEKGNGYIMHYTDSNEYEPLDTLDKFSVLHTWDSVAYSIAMGIDPTSIDDNEL